MVYICNIYSYILLHLFSKGWFWLQAQDEMSMESMAVNLVFLVRPKSLVRLKNAPVAVIVYKKRSWHRIDGCTSSYSTGGQFSLRIY